MDILFRTIFGILFFINVGERYYIHWKQRSLIGKKHGKEGLANFLIKRTLILVYSSFSILYVFSPDYISWSSIALPLPLTITGALVVILATPLHIWAFKALNKYYLPTLQVLENHKLVTNGPYKWVRHPIYSSTLVGIFGSAVLANNIVLFGLSIIALCLALFSRIPSEEKMLVKTFGNEYKKYMKRTGKLLPKLRQ